MNTKKCLESGVVMLLTIAPSKKILNHFVTHVPLIFLVASSVEVLWVFFQLHISSTFFMCIFALTYINLLLLSTLKIRNSGYSRGDKKKFLEKYQKPLCIGNHSSQKDNSDVNKPFWNGTVSKSFKILFHIVLS